MTERFVGFVPSPDRVILKMLEMSEHKDGEMLYDLGSGRDAKILRIAAKKYGLKGVGIEIDHELACKSRDIILEDGLEDYIKIKEGSILDFPLGDADIVTAYLNSRGMAAIEDKVLSELKPSARIVSHDYGFRKIKPNETKITWAWADGKNPPMLFPQPVFHWINLYRMDEIRMKKHFKQIRESYKSNRSWG
jgi:hypothetical protein